MTFHHTDANQTRFPLCYNSLIIILTLSQVEETNKNTHFLNLNKIKSTKRKIKKGRRQKAIYRLILRQKIVTPENYLEIWDSSATLIGQLAIVTLFRAMLGGIPLSGAYPKKNYVKTSIHPR